MNPIPLFSGLVLFLSIYLLKGEEGISPTLSPDSPPISYRDTLPIPSSLTQEQVARYYPGILDTQQRVGIVGAEPLDIETAAGHVVSMFHQTGTFDQMTLCTHDTQLVLIDHHYIGKATQFDRTSHTIAFQQIGTNRLVFHHVDWGYVTKAGETEIDTIGYKKYVLRITDSGMIEKE